MPIDPSLLRQCWFLAGPTASGKSAVAMLLARQLGAEIIALDSMTLYRGMDIGTAKPTAEDQSAVRHHLIDVLDPHEDFSVAQYLVLAEGAIQDILARGGVPLFVGGSGLYLRSLLRGVFEGPPADWNLRRQLEQEVEQAGVLALHERLRAIDPLTAARLSPNDVRRVSRAIEVHTLTGQPLSEQQKQLPLPPEERPRRVYWLDAPRPWLHERIDRRVLEMLEAGLIEEVRGLLTRRPPLGPTARQGLGYKEVIDWLEQGSGSLSDVAVTIQTRTRQFAKRQCTWFRNLEECQPVPLQPKETVEALCERILQTGVDSHG